MNINNLAKKYENFKQSKKKDSSVQILNDKKVIIECCKEVMLYDENMIKLRIAVNVIVIVGTNLTMKNFSTDGIIINGKISSVSFEESERI